MKGNKTQDPQDEFETELAAAAEFHERTARQWTKLTFVEQRKEIEKYLEKHE